MDRGPVQFSAFFVALTGFQQVWQLCDIGRNPPRLGRMYAGRGLN
jgi:hypothetical protein